MAYSDLPILTIRIGREEDLPAVPPSHQSALWTLATNSSPTGFFYKLYISNENSEWEEFLPFLQPPAPFNIGFSSGFFTEDLPATELVGVIKLYGGTTAPNNYLQCNGATVSRSTYSALVNFAIAEENIGVGLLFGDGDGSTTFLLPDLTPFNDTMYIIRY